MEGNARGHSDHPRGSNSSCHSHGSRHPRARFDRHSGPRRPRDPPSLSPIRTRSARTGSPHRALGGRRVPERIPERIPERVDRSFSRRRGGVRHDPHQRRNTDNRRKPGKNAIPDRWLDYTNVGCPIPGTSIVALKVPLRSGIVTKAPAEARFGPADVSKLVPTIGMVLDLTATKRYYDPSDLIAQGIRYQKIYCMGHVIPARDVVRQFFRIMDEFMGDPRRGESLIGVHCTHGVNRTGYLVCRYMIERLGLHPGAAIEQFESARGHKIERELYVKDLHALKMIPRPLPPAKTEERIQGQAF